MDSQQITSEIQRHIQSFAITNGLAYDHPNVLDGFDLDAETWHIANATAAARLSSVAYDDEPTAKANVAHYCDSNEFRFRWFNHEPTCTQAFVYTTGSSIHVVFRGSESVRDWLQNLNGKKVSINLSGDNGRVNGMVHQGFFQGFEAISEELIQFVGECSPTESRRVWLCGHSLGGALATIAAAGIACEYGAASIGALYTFGQPRVFDRQAKNALLNLIGRPKIHRVYRCADPVAIVPKAFGYKHVSGERQYISRSGVLLPDTSAFRKWWERSLTWLTVGLKVGYLRFRSDSLHELVSHHYMNGYLRALRENARFQKDAR